MLMPWLQWPDADILKSYSGVLSFNFSVKFQPDLLYMQVPDR